ncbi:hypothetical protein D3C74_385390 [compost metagenome]
MAIMMTNRVLRPGNRSQAKAYAAKEAISTGMTVAGTAIVSVFQKAWDSPVPFCTVSLPSASVSLYSLPDSTLL